MNQAHSAQERQHSTSKQQHGQKISETTDRKKNEINYPQCSKITDVHKPQGYMFLISRNSNNSKTNCSCTIKNDWEKASNKPTVNSLKLSTRDLELTYQRQRGNRTKSKIVLKLPLQTEPPEAEQVLDLAQGDVVEEGPSLPAASCSTVFITEDASPPLS